MSTNINFMSTARQSKDTIEKNSVKLNTENQQFVEAEALNTVIENLCERLTSDENVETKQKIWILMLFLETLQNDFKKSVSAKSDYADNKKINSRNSACATDYKILKKYENISDYCLLLEDLSNILKEFLESYVVAHTDEYLKGIYNDESREAYISELYSHYCCGDSWIDDSSIRSNIINKIEVFFRGFSKKSVRFREKKDKKNSGATL